MKIAEFNRKFVGLLVVSDILQYLNHLRGSLCPGHCGGVDFLERMYNVGIVQGDVGFAEGRAVAGVKGRVPLLVLITETHDSNVAFGQ